MSIVRQKNTYSTPHNEDYAQLYSELNKYPRAIPESVTVTGTLRPSQTGLVLGDTSGGAVITTLPAAGGNLGLSFTFKLVDATSTWTIQRDGSDTIDGATTLVLSVLNSAYTIQSDGVSKWYIVGKV